MKTPKCSAAWKHKRNLLESMVAINSIVINKFTFIFVVQTLNFIEPPESAGILVPPRRCFRRVRRRFSLILYLHSIH
jgi:hypothetical protein